MAGSIRQRPDKGPDAFELRVFLGRDASGRVRHRSVLFRGTRRAAERELARLVSEQDADPALVPSTPERAWGPATTINDAIAGWRANGWEDLSPSTRQRYESIWRCHIERSIGRRKIASLSPYDVELYLRALKNQGQASASVRQVRAVLNRACRLARKWSGNALPNPIADSELPEWRLDEEREPVRAPEIDEVARLLAAAGRQDVRFATYLRVVVATGMRRGEACALRWEDFDERRSTLTIDESAVSDVGLGVVVKPPKTRASIRVVALDPNTVAGLIEYRRRADDVAKLAGMRLETSHFIFAAEPPWDRPPAPEAMSHAFARFRVAANVADDVHLHSLRHFHATLLDPVISEAQKQARLGWSTVQMARHYTDAIGEEDRRAAEHVGNVLDRPLA